MSQYVLLTSLRDSNPLPTKHIYELVRHKTPVGSFSSHFHSSVSVNPFHTSVSMLQRFPLSPVFMLPAKATSL